MRNLLLSASLSLQFSARHLLRPHSSLWKLRMDSCVIPQGLVCCGSVVPNLSPVKGKATCTFVNLSASTSLSILFAQPSPPIPTKSAFWKCFILKKALDVVLMSMYSLSHSSVHSHMRNIYLCACVFVYVYTYLCISKMWKSSGSCVSFGYKKYQCWPLNLIFWPQF